MNINNIKWLVICDVITHHIPSSTRMKRVHIYKEQSKKQKRIQKVSREAKENQKSIKRSKRESKEYQEKQKRIKRVSREAKENQE